MNDEIINLYKSIGNNHQEVAKAKQQPKITPISQNMTQFVPVRPQQQQATTSLKDFSDKPLKRSFSNIDSLETTFAPENTIKPKREKCSKGLRHFSMKVCEKVKQKNVTSYNEVADELVNEYCSLASTYQTNNEMNSSNVDFWSYDQKNVRRRVYDALNVLMAMNIISKEKKEIKWIGLPCNKKQECQDFEIEKKKKQEAIAQKSEHLKDLINEQIALKSLIDRNKEKNVQMKSKLNIPFLVFNTDKKTQIDFTISNDRKEYLIQFDKTFEVNSHLNVIKNLGLTLESSKNDAKSVEKYSKMVPKLFEPYVNQLVVNDKLEPLNLLLNIPNYSSSNNDKKNSSLKQKQASKISPKSDLENENSMYDDEEENMQLSNDENDSEDNGDQMTDEENSFENEDDNSLADSLSF